MTSEVVESPPEETAQLYKLCPTCRYATPAERDRCHHCLADVARAEILHPDAAQRRLTRQAEIEVEREDRELRRRRIRRAVLATLAVVVVAYVGWWTYRTFIWEPPPLPLPVSADRGMAPVSEAWPTVLGDATASRATTVSPALDGSEAWRADLGATPVTGLIADGDRLYAALTDDRLVAIDLEDGAVAWERELQVAPIGAPTVAGDRVYVGMRAGQLLAVDAETGEEIFFSLNTGARFNSSPIVVDGTVFVNGVGALVAFDAENGDILWTREVDSTWATLSPVVIDDSVALASGDRSLVYSRLTSLETYFYEFERAHPYSIAYADGAVYTASNRVIAAYDANSRRPWWEGMRAVWFQFEIWQMAPSVPPPPAFWAVRRPPADAFPMAVGSEHLFIANSKGDFRAYSRATGDLAWAVTTPDIASPPLLTPEGLLIAHGDRLALYDPASGDLLADRGFEAALEAGDLIEDVMVTNAGTFVLTGNGGLIALR